MVKGRPLFPGSSVEDQLKLIFSVLGTPPKDCWPNLEIPYSFPKYARESLSFKVPRLDHTAVDLLERFLCVSIPFSRALIFADDAFISRKVVIIHHYSPHDPPFRSILHNL